MAALLNQNVLKLAGVELCVVFKARPSPPSSDWAR